LNAGSRVSEAAQQRHGVHRCVPTNSPHPGALLRAG
jgi:hypothetical protein